MISYSSDATSFLCSSIAETRSLGDRVVRRGRVLHEFLMQRGFIIGFSVIGEQHAAILMSDPLPLTQGKKSTNLFAAGCKFYQLLRMVGHSGISIFHRVTDRAVLSSLERLFRQRQAAYYKDGLGLSLEDDKVILEYTDLFLACGCAAHDIQNSIKWALDPYLSSE